MSGKVAEKKKMEIISCGGRSQLCKVRVINRKVALFLARMGLSAVLTCMVINVDRTTGMSSSKFP